MDAVVETCLNCGDPLTEPRKLKDFCTYSCRGQHAVNTLPGVPHRGAYSGSKNLKKTRALHTLRKQSLGAITFCKINSVTYRIDRRTKNGVGWLMEVAWPGESRQRWVARVGDRASDPLPLEQAKAAAKDLLSTKGKAEPRDWIAELNQAAANEVGRAVIERQRRQWPVNLMGMSNRQTPIWKVDPKSIDPESIQAVMDIERVLIEPDTGAIQGDDYSIETDADGYPILPACLDRRPKPALAKGRMSGPVPRLHNEDPCNGHRA
jgi:hypothetical protein